MQKIWLPVFLIAALCGTCVLGHAAAPLNPAVAKHIDGNSVFAKYYAQYAAQYGKHAGSPQQAFREFCELLRDSDLLAIEIVENGMSANRVYQALETLGRSDLSTADAATIRDAIHAVDYALESIEFTFTRNHRGEFRREVLAQIPPLSFSS